MVTFAISMCFPVAVLIRSSGEMASARLVNDRVGEGHLAGTRASAAKGSTAVARAPAETVDRGRRHCDVGDDDFADDLLPRLLAGGARRPLRAWCSARVAPPASASAHTAAGRILIESVICRLRCDDGSRGEEFSTRRARQP
jgi:hypothetical protein